MTRPSLPQRTFANGPSRLVVLLAGLLVGCAVGPDYVPPELPQLRSFARSGPEPTAPPQEYPQAFWRGLGDPLLDRLIDAALEHNHDIRMAYANYLQAQALQREVASDRWPAIAAGAEWSHRRSSADQAAGEGRAARDNRTYQLDVGLAWELDLFGRVRRSAEAQEAQTQANAADVASMQVAVVGELLRSYLAMRGQQEQLRSVRASAHNLHRSQAILQWRQAAGAGSQFDVDRASADAEAVLARIPNLEADIAVSVHRIAVLTGQAPQALIDELEREPARMQLSWGPVLVDAPGALLRRRPDVAGAERRLAAATARVGVATADLFPRFTLGGLMGTQAFDPSALFRRDSEFRQIVFGVDGAFLNVGRVRSRLAASNAAVAHDLAVYERAVLVALEETENALSHTQRSEAALMHLQRAAGASAAAVRHARVRFDNGAIGMLDLLDAERTSLVAEQALAQGRTQRAQAQLALFRAMAGGWVSSATQEVANADRRHP